MSCENQPEQSEVVDRVGKIELSEQCELVTSSISIHTNKVINGVCGVTYLPRFKFSTVKAISRAANSKPIKIKSVTKIKRKNIAGGSNRINGRVR